MSESSEPVSAWRCTVCGYVHRGPLPPDACPVCGAPTDQFEPFAEAAAPAPREPATQWRCINCGYVHDDPHPPEACPVCGAAAERFEALHAAPAAPPVDERELRVVIVGAGIAGVSATEAVRSAMPHARLALITREPALPYYRLNLTRFLAGEISRDVLPIHEADWYRANRIDLSIAAEVTALDLAARQVAIGDGEPLAYDRLILAMGSHAFVPPIAGVDTAGVMTLRTAQDAAWILDVARSGTPCVIVGGGVLGMETAGALAQQGADVTLLESHDWLMPRQLNREAGERLGRHIESIGVRLRRRARTSAIRGEGTVSEVELDDGTILPAGLVILTTGIRPNTHLARRAGLDVNQGIIVGNHLQTSAPDVYAAGDVAEHNGQVYGVWEASQYQGRIAGLNAAGVPTTFGGLPRSNTLKVLGIDLTSIGKFQPDDGSFITIDGASDERYIHFVFRDGTLVGSILLGAASAAADVKRAIEKRLDCSGLLAHHPSADDVLAHLRAG